MDGDIISASYLSVSDASPEGVVLPTPTRYPYTYTMPDIQQGVSGYALRFDGGDWAQAGSNSIFDETSFSALTLETWIQPLGNGTGKVALLSLPGAVRIELEDMGVSLSLQTRERLAMVETHNGSVADGQWSHIAGVWDGRIMKLYQNGVLVDEEPASGLVVPNAD